jgi:hypothetical protein
MVEIEDITFKDYVEIEDKSLYDYCIKFAYSFNNPIDHFKIGDFTELSFGIVKDIQFDMAGGIGWEKLIEYFEILSGRNKKEISGMRLIELCQSKKYLSDEIEKINHIESEALSYIPDADEERAGIDRFNTFGAYLQFRSIATIFAVDIETVRSWKYSHCLIELYYQKMSYDYEKELLRIRNKNG